MRAIALVLVFALVTVFGWSAHDSLAQSNFAESGFGPAPASQTSPANGASGHGTSSPSDKFFLPRQLLVETARSTLTGPPQPQPALPPAVPSVIEARWAHFAPWQDWAVATLPEGIGWSSPRTPTGPPAGKHQALTQIGPA